jgi:hypothetical protein
MQKKSMQKWGEGERVVIYNRDGSFCSEGTVVLAIDDSRQSYACVTPDNWKRGQQYFYWPHWKQHSTGKYIARPGEPAPPPKRKKRVKVIQLCFQFTWSTGVCHGG